MCGKWNVVRQAHASPHDVGVFVDRYSTSMALPIQGPGGSNIPMTSPPQVAPKVSGFTNIHSFPSLLLIRIDLDY